MNERHGHSTFPQTDDCIYFGSNTHVPDLTGAAALDARQLVSEDCSRVGWKTRITTPFSSSASRTSLHRSHLNSDNHVPLRKIAAGPMGTAYRQHRTNFDNTTLIDGNTHHTHHSVMTMATSATVAAGPWELPTPRLSSTSPPFRPAFRQHHDDKRTNLLTK